MRGPTLATTARAVTSAPDSSRTPTAAPPSTSTRATGASSVDLDARLPRRPRAMAWVIAPMPPMAWPQAPFLPFTSPNTWCSST